MTDYNGNISNLIQGVSKQSPMQRFEGQLEAQKNCVSSITDGLKRRPGTELIANIGNSYALDTFYYTYDRGDGDEKYLIRASAGIISVYDLETGAEKIVTNSAGLYSYIRNGNLKFHTIGDTTFVLNTEKKVLKSNYITAPFSHEYIYLVHLDKANYGTKYTVYAKDSTGNIIGASAYTTDSNVTVSSTTMDKTIGVSTDEVMNALKTPLQNWLDVAHPGMGSFVSVRGGVMIVASNADLELSVTDTNGNNDISCITDTIDSYDELPNYCLSGLKIKVQGRKESGWDDYYVQFESDQPSEVISSGRWRECAAWGIHTSLYPQSMPHKIVRNSNGTFTCLVCDWVHLEAGDLDSNPMPSFVDDYITDIFFYQNRMLLSTKNSVCASMTDDYYNFFADTVTASSDADPIDTSASDSKVSDIRHLIDFNGHLVIFGKQAQYLHPSDQPFDSSHFALVSKSNFSFEVQATPQVSNTQIYFPFSLGNYSGIRSLDANTLTGNLTGTNITQHVDGYISGDIKEIICSSNNNYLIASLYGSNDLYIYQWFSLDGSLKQQAWHKWEFPSLQLIEKLDIIDNILYIVGKPVSSTESVILTLDLTASSSGGLGHQIHLDNSSLVTGIDLGDGYYHCTFPSYYPESMHSSLVVVLTGSFENGGELLTASDGSEFGLAGFVIYLNNSDYPVYEGMTPVIHIGTLFESEAELTNPYIKSYQGDAINKGTLRYKNFLFNLVDTGYVCFKVRKYDTEYEYEFDGKRVNTESAIINKYTVDNYLHQLPVRARQDNTRIKIHSDNHLPFNITHVEWSGTYNEKGRRI